MVSIVIITGVEPYSDRWHAQDATSARVGELLEEWGHHVLVTSDVAQSAIREADLVVVNSTGRGAAADPALAEVDREISSWRDAGIPVLALHGSAISFRGSRAWRGLLGGAWNPGVSGHPQIGNCLIHTHGGHDTVAATSDFTVYDERYSGLDVDPTSRVTASHVEDGIRHPLAWARVDEGGSRVVYDGLGHGVESYDSPGRVAFLRAEVNWLLGVTEGA